MSTRALQCKVPSLLIHESGKLASNLTQVVEAEYIVNAAPSPPPPNAAQVILGGDQSSLYQRSRAVNTTLIKEDRVAALRFDGLDDASLPRGSTLVHVALAVTPQSGGDGAVQCIVRANLACADDPSFSDLLSPMALAAFNESNTTIEWDMQPLSLIHISEPTRPY